MVTCTYSMGSETLSVENSIMARELSTTAYPVGGGDLSRSVRWAWLILFSFVMLDSMINYFIKHRLGVVYPVNALAIPFMLVIPVFFGLAAIRIPAWCVAALIATAAGFVLGIAVDGEVRWELFGQLASAFVAFITGLNAVYFCANRGKLFHVLIALGGLYSLVCAMAVARLAPGFFPVIDAIRYENGIEKIRPEVTADQNFQVFYIFPAALILVIRLNRPFVALVAAFLAMTPLYVVAQLQSRSGFLLIGATIALSFVLPAWSRHRQWRSLFILPVVVFALAAWKFQAIVGIIGGLLDRFGNLQTLGNRLDAAWFLITNFWNPTMWLPIGDSAYVARAGDVPHCNPTGVFLRGGILALVGWVVLSVYPLWRGAKLVIKRQLDPSGYAVFIGGLVMFTASLSLNVVLHDQMWLWSGAVVGLIEIYRHVTVNGIESRFASPASA